MDTGASVESLLRQIAILLDKHGETTWAESLKRWAAEYGESPESTSRIILSLFRGGMASFDDVVLYGPDGTPLHWENEELDRLGSQLFAACLATIPELKATEDGRRRLSRIAEIEGYLSLLIIVSLSLLIVVLNSCLPLCTHLFSLLPDIYRLLLVLLVFTIWVLAVLFAVSGVRHGTGMGCVSAGLSFVIMAILVVYLLLPVNN
jgi:hypothetical protein